MAIFIFLWQLQGSMEKIRLEYTESFLMVRMIKTVSSYLKMLLNSFIKCLTAVQTCQKYSRYDA